MKHTINDGLRMMGQLLLHHPTTRYYSRDQAGTPTVFYAPESSCFCFVGAAMITVRTLQLGTMDLATRARETVFPPDAISFEEWDNGTDAQRKQWAQQLASVSAP